MRVLKEYVAVVHLVAGLFALVLAAGLLPGDSFNVNTAGALECIVLLAIADGILTGPAYLFARRRGTNLRAFRN